MIRKMPEYVNIKNLCIIINIPLSMSISEYCCIYIYNGDLEYGD